MPATSAITGEKWAAVIVIGNPVDWCRLSHALRPVAMQHWRGRRLSSTGRPRSLPSGKLHAYHAAVVPGQNDPGVGRTTMPNLNLSAPTVPVFWISVALAVLALIGHFGGIPALATYQFWLAIIAYVVLLLGNVLKGM